MAGAVVLAVLIGGGLAQLVYNPPREVSGWRTATLMAGSISKLELNAMGFRGQPIQYGDQDRVVLLVGDSQVEATPGCSFAWMPERRLEHYLTALGNTKTKVFTLGSSGYGQDQQLLVLQEYFVTHRADLVILWETPDNDVWNNIFPTHWPANGTPKPTFRLEGGSLWGPTEGVEHPLPVPTFWWEAFWGRLVGTLGRDEEWEQFLPPAYAPLTAYDGPVNRSWEEVEHKLVDENLETEKSHRALFLTPPSARMQYGVELTRKLMEGMRRSAEAHGAAFVTFYTTQASTQLMPVKNYDPEVYRFRAKHYRVSRRQREETIRELNQGFQTYSISVTAENPEMGPANGHLNEHAVDQVMRDLADQLKPLIH